MKMLFWKEWYELRYLPAGAAVSVAALMSVAKVYAVWYHEAFPTADGTLPILVGVWALFAVLAGGGTIAQEIGTGTLQFLSSLPVSRRTVWWIKAGTAFGMLVPSLIAAMALWALLSLLWSPGGIAVHVGQAWPGILAGTFSFLLSVFTVALAVSPFFDRALSGVVAAIVTAIAVEALFVSVGSRYTGSQGVAILYTLVGLSVPTFAAISYWTFTRGETLRGPRRFVVAGTTAGICLAVAAVLLVVAGAFGAWS